MLISLFTIICGLGLLLGGGTILVPGTISLAKHFGISARIIAFVIIAGGTSAPELLVSVNAAFHDSPAIVWGNILGSNLANSLLVLGLAALAAPIATHDKATRWDLIFLFLVTLFVFLCLYFGGFSGGLGIFLSALLVVCFIAYVLHMIHSEQDLPQDSQTPQKTSTKIAYFYVIGGIISLVFGAELFVKGGIELARLSGWSEAFIGLTIIAIGTSLPEIISVCASILHKRSDIALGNVMGSNLFNILIALGGAGFAGSLTIMITPVLLPFILLLAFCPILLFISYRNIPLSVGIGLVFIGFYFSFLVFEGWVNSF